MLTSVLIKRWSLILFPILIFLLIPPYFLWNNFSPLIFIILSTILILFNIDLNNLKTLIFTITALLLYVYVFSKTNPNIFGTLSYLCIVLVFSGRKDFMSEVWSVFCKIYSVALIPSLIIYCVTAIFKLHIPYIIISPLNSLKNFDYLAYPFLVQGKIITDAVLPRFYGYFDEPGVVGTISAVMLLSNKFNLKLKYNIPILISGILSFSFAFYLATLTYILFLAKGYYKLFALLIILLLFLGFKSNETVYEYVFKRFEFENGKFLGDNRENQTYSIYYNQFSKTTEFYYGKDINKSSELNYGGASYKDLIIDYGIIFFLFFLIFFVFISILEIGFFRREFLISLLILALILYQRPFITQYFYIFLLYGSIIFLSKNTNHRKNDLLIKES